MNVFVAGLTLLLFVTLIGVVVLWGHVSAPADRLLAASLSAALSLCLLLVLAQAWAEPMLEEVGLALAVLGAVGVSCLSLRAQAERRGRALGAAVDKPLP